MLPTRMIYHCESNKRCSTAVPGYVERGEVFAEQFNQKFESRVSGEEGRIKNFTNIQVLYDNFVLNAGHLHERM